MYPRFPVACIHRRLRTRQLVMGTKPRAVDTNCPMKNIQEKEAIKKNQLQTITAKEISAFSAA